MTAEMPKDVDSFKESFQHEEPPHGLTNPLKALWHAAKGSWDKAHQIIQDDHSKEAAWVHAHLHRVEGDHDNANYWYTRAGKEPHDGSNADELNLIAFGLLSQGGR